MRLIGSGRAVSRFVTAVGAVGVLVVLVGLLTGHGDAAELGLASFLLLVLGWVLHDDDGEGEPDPAFVPEADFPRGSGTPIS